MNNAAILASDEGCFKKTSNGAPVLKCILVNDVTDIRSLPKSQYFPSLNTSCIVGLLDPILEIFGHLCSEITN